MRPVFGDSIDWDRVVIRTGGVRDSAMDPHAVAYEVHLTPERDGAAVFGADGETLTGEGLALLAHELTHVWQYERFGPGYIGEAIRDGHFHGDAETYRFRDDLAAGAAFEDMEPEAQAALIETIYRAIAPDEDGGPVRDLTLEGFNEVLREALSEAALPEAPDGALFSAEFEIVVRAHHALVRS